MKNKPLNRKLSIPLYVQLKEILLGELRSNVLKPGEKIKTEFELMKDYGVSRNVVRQAIGGLADSGYLIRKRAKGTFVSTQTTNAQQRTLQENFRETVIRSGGIPVIKTLSTEILDANKVTADLLGVVEETRIICIRRLWYSDEAPVSISTSYMPYAKCDFVLEHHLQNDSLYHVLGQRYDTRIYRATHRLRARNADAEEAHLLQMTKDSVVQCLTRQSYSCADMVIEATLAVYKGDFELGFETVEQTSKQR